MPIATLLTARSLHHGGIKFLQNRGKKVTDKVANELENDLPGYFDIDYSPDAEEAPEPKAAAVKAKTKAKGTKGKITINKPVSAAKAAALARVNKTSGEVDGEELDTGNPGRVVTV